MATLTNSLTEQLHAAAQKAEGRKEETYKVGNFFRLISLVSPSGFEGLSADPDDPEYIRYVDGAVYGYNDIPCLYAIEPVKYFKFPRFEDIPDDYFDPHQSLRGGRLYIEPGYFCGDKLNNGFWLGSVLKDRIKHPWLSEEGLLAASSELLSFYELGVNETERRCALFQKRVWKKEED